MGVYMWWDKRRRIGLGRMAPQLVLLCIALHVILLGCISNAELPQDLDSFLEVLFDATECEEFLSDSEWVAVATHTCAPYECDFPRQLCMRPSKKFSDEGSNQCRDIPEECLTSANKGVPLETPAPKEIASTLRSSLMSTLATTPSIFTTGAAQVEASSTATKRPSPPIVNMSICDMDEAQGRFCGFQVKIAYNRKTGRCEQFWFPGCTTADTNANLFDTLDECVEATKSCTGVRPRIVQPALPKLLPFTSAPRHSPPPRPVFPSSLPPAPVPPRFPQRPSPASPFSLSSFFKGGSTNTGPNVVGTNEALLGLISNGISQFTGVGGVDNGGFLDGFSLAQIPQLIQTIQSVSGKR
uniref:BPTI/Kunitz inhibitor domain-containing protein n=2 Tax=Parascaris univalens TaxID=6257 RepID=A0A915CBQ1_PARUN